MRFPRFAGQGMRGLRPLGEESACRVRIPRSSMARAVEARKGGAKPVSQIASDLGISESCLRTLMWSVR